MNHRELSLTEREARLKEVYAAEYPGIPPEVWMPVAELAAKLVERVRARRREGRFTRTFDPTHFEFRGGPPRRTTMKRTRSTDRKGPLAGQGDQAQQPPQES
jgi:hypothetical protein